MKPKTLLAVIIVAVLLVAAAALAYVAAYGPAARRPSPGPVACTMEAKLCPDGSYVGRGGPNCEFAPCPGTPPAPAPSGTCGPDQGTCQKGYTCIQHCGPPVVREGDAPPTWYCETDAIAAQPRMCPICLAKDTRIATPNGEVQVQDVKIGMKVWSLDANGKKVSSRVTTVAHTPVPKTHRVVHLVLADGRELWVSPDHPTSSGARVGDLRDGQSYDGSTVVSAGLVPYWSDSTYDLLPDSETGMYWADGILMGSTLKAR